jgi:hypothetical protein
VQVVSIALEDVVVLDADLYIEIARRPAIGAGLSVAGGADAHAVVDAGRDLHFQRLLALDLALAAAAGAGLGTRNDAGDRRGNRPRADRHASLD